jgi:hypothetical protein
MDAARSDHQMHVVRHEGICVQGASLLFQAFAQPVEVSVIVFLDKEAGFMCPR